MNTLALFDQIDLEPAWVPIRSTPVDWPDRDSGNGGFTKETWAAWRKEHPERCRDCGTTHKINAGGSNGWMCDDCAEIDQCRDLNCTPVLERRTVANFTVDELAHCDNCHWFIHDRSAWDDEFDAEDLSDELANHARPRHVSHWGKSHLIGEHDRLIRERSKRRSQYLKAQVGA
jgi:hypothetical protein